MPLLKRKPRKLAKLTYAMEVLGESRTTVNNRIARGELQVIPGRGKTSPKRIFVAEVDAIAKELGIF